MALLAFGVVGSLIYLVRLVRPNRLEIDASGFTVIRHRRRWRAEWSDCGPFRVRATYDEWDAVSQTVAFHCTAPMHSGRLGQLRS